MIHEYQRVCQVESQLIMNISAYFRRRASWSWILASISGRGSADHEYQGVFQIERQLIMNIRACFGRESADHNH